MPSTAVNAIPYPDLATPAQPDVPADLQALAEAVDRKVIGSFTNATARDAAIPSPTDGMGLAYLQDVDQFTARVNGAWVSVPVANATWQDPVAGTAGLRTIGTGAQQAAAGTTTVTVTAAEVRAYATPGAPCPGITTPAPVALTTTFQDAVAAPATSHIRVVKGIVLAGQTGAATVTIAVGGTDVIPLSLAAGAQFGGDLGTVLLAGEAFQVKSSAAGRCLVSYVDLPTSSAVSRFGFAVSSGTGTLVTSSGSVERVLTEVLFGNTGAVAATITLSVGGNALPTLTVPASGIASLGLPIDLPVSTAVTYAGDGVSAVSMLASGYTI
jgi:hypothetical protein